MLTLKYQPTQRAPYYFFQVESSANFLCKDLSIIAYPTKDSKLGDNFTQLSAQALSSMKYVVGIIVQSGSKDGFTMLGASFDDSQHGILRDQDITLTLLTSRHFGHSFLHGDFMAMAHFQANIDHSEVAICSPDGKGGDFEYRECKFDTLTFEALGPIVRFPVKRAAKRFYTNIEEEEEKSHPEKKTEYKEENLLRTVGKDSRRDFSHFDTSSSGGYTSTGTGGGNSDVSYQGKKHFHRGEDAYLAPFDLTPLLDNTFSEECHFPQDVFETDVVFVELPAKK